jgi:hypothetical protein
MVVDYAEFEHPTQASRVRLSVYEQRPPEVETVAGLLPREPGYLVTEDRVGAGKVVSTLGFFRARDEALACLRARARQLELQRYRSLPRTA